MARERTNEDRRNDAATAIDKSSYADVAADDCLEGAIIDLGTDLLHLAESHGIDPEMILRQIKSNYEIEQEESE